MAASATTGFATVTVLVDSLESVQGALALTQKVVIALSVVCIALLCIIGLLLFWWRRAINRPVRPRSYESERRAKPQRMEEATGATELVNLSGVIVNGHEGLMPRGSLVSFGNSAHSRFSVQSTPGKPKLDPNDTIDTEEQDSQGRMRSIFRSSKASGLRVAHRGPVRPWSAIASAGSAADAMLDRPPRAARPQSYPATASLDLASPYAESSGLVSSEYLLAGRSLTPTAARSSHCHLRLYPLPDNLPPSIGVSGNESWTPRLPETIQSPVALQTTPPTPGLPPLSPPPSPIQARTSLTTSSKTSSRPPTRPGRAQTVSSISVFSISSSRSGSSAHFSSLFFAPASVSPPRHSAIAEREDGPNEFGER